jgi:hypothetical protein
MLNSLASTTRLTIATALTGTAVAALAITAAAPSASAATQQVRSDSRINIASVSVRSLALTLSPKPGTAVLTWAVPRARTKFTVMATPVKRPSATRMFKATSGPVVSFAGLDENARYTFTVTPQVGKLTGPTSRLLMTATLKQLRSLSIAEQLKTVSTASSANATTALLTSATSTVGNPTTQTAAITTSTQSAQASAPQPATAPQLAPQPAAAPAAPAPPRTRTVYVCPDGFTEVNSICTTTLPYTYSTLAYTFHQEPYTVTVQDPPTVYAADRAQSTGSLCPWGGSPNAAGDLCSIAGGTHQETRYNTVKDVAPSGYTDTGTEWKKKNATPAGYTDDGTQWFKTTAKIATEVPA